MRKLLWLLTLFALAYQSLITISALAGPSRLPDRIPTHFDLAGNPTSWGSPHALYLLPAIAIVISLLLALVNRNPASFRYPVRVNPQNRDRLYALGRQTMAFLAAEISLLFATLQWSFLHAFRTSHFTLNPAIVPIATAAILLTALAHTAAMRKSNQTR
jgi:uncharacterized membrane protein